MDEKKAPPESFSKDQHVVQSTYIKPQARKLHDPDVTFEEYHYYACRTRELEKHLESPSIQWRELMLRRKAAREESNGENNVGAAKEINFSNMEERMNISDDEWANASRAFRTASWGACFYLITTDILGPYGVGYAMGTLGWGPGIALYTVFGFMAGYSGYLIWHTFLGLDSYQFPLRNYGDLAYRTWGKTARHSINFLQALALLLVLGQVVIVYGQNLSQLSRFKLCYVLCPMIFCIAGFFITQIRTLKAYGWVANLAVWLNLLTIFLTMGFVSHSPPNYAISTLGSAGTFVNPETITPDAQGIYPPIVHYSGLPLENLIGSINGLLSGVFAYAGAQLFVEFMAEMKRPTEFIKAMWGAQFFIFTVYLVYGCFIYYYQGQYSYNPAYQGVSIYSWQCAGNVLTLIAALIAAGLYGNIGIKVLYNNLLMEIFNAPPLITTRGKILWAVIVPIWWTVAFVIAASIPNYLGFVSVVAASTLLNLTYAIPPFLALGYDCQLQAMREGEGLDPVTGTVVRRESDGKRWMRGFVGGGLLRTVVNVFHVLYFLASLAMCGLGMYAAVVGMIEAFKIPQLNSFSCVSPLNLNAE